MQPSSREDEMETEAKMEAALSSTEGTLWSPCSVFLERGAWCGFGGVGVGALVCSVLSVVSCSIPNTITACTVM